MHDRCAAYRWDGRDLILELRVQPRASRDQLVGVLETRLKVRITAPPVDGKANSHLVRFLAKLFGVANSQVEIETGMGSRDKTVRVRKPGQLPTLIDTPPTAGV